LINSISGNSSNIAFPSNNGVATPVSKDKGRKPTNGATDQIQSLCGNERGLANPINIIGIAIMAGCFLFFVADAIRSFFIIFRK
jgi:hypothetical protein